MPLFFLQCLLRPYTDALPGLESEKEQNMKGSKPAASPACANLFVALTSFPDPAAALRV